MPRRAPSIDLDAIVAGIVAGDDADEVTTAVLDATAALLAAYGVRRWSVDDVAERSGLGRTTVYRRFDNRDELVTAVLAREARRFFAAIGEAVADVEPIEDKVVEGFIVGVRAMRGSVLTRLLETDAALMDPMLHALPLLATARIALVESAGELVPVAQQERVDVVAETLVRLAMSFVVLPDSVVDFDDVSAARAALRPLLAPMIAAAGATGPPAPKKAPAGARGARKTPPRKSQSRMTPPRQVRGSSPR